MEKDTKHFGGQIPADLADDVEAIIDHENNQGAYPRESKSSVLRTALTNFKDNYHCPEVFKWKAKTTKPKARR